MKKHDIKLTTNGIVLILFVALLPSVVTASLSPGNTFTSFFWTQESGSTVLNGCTGHLKIDSYDDKSGNYSSTFWMKKIWDWWPKQLSYTLKLAISTDKNKPSAITEASNHFSSVEWVTGIEHTGSKDAIRFYFPLLPQSLDYGRYDYFTVSVNDTMDINFYGAGDSIMVGTFVHKEQDSSGAVNILARNAIIVELTRSNSLRIKSIRCNGAHSNQLSEYLNYDLQSFKKDAAWYGFTVTDTLNVSPKLVVNSVNINGIQQIKNTKSLKADSSYQITWKINIPSEVDSCEVFVSLDNKRSWNKIGATGAESSFMWKVPLLKSDSTFLKVNAVDKNGQTAYAISESMFSIDLSSITSIVNVVRRNYPPSITPEAYNNGLKVHYTLPLNTKMVTIYLYDLKGRCIRVIKEQTNNFTGIGSFLINNYINSGYYYIIFNATFSDAKKPIVMTRKWLQLH